MRDNTAIDSLRRGDNKSIKEIKNKNVDVIIVTGSNKNKVYDELKCNNVNNIRRDNVSHNDRNIQTEIFKQKWIKRLEERMSNQRMKKILFRKGLDAFLLHMDPSGDGVDLLLDYLDSKLDEWRKLGYIPMQELMKPLGFP